MCEPTTATFVAMGLTAASAGYSLYRQDKMADAHEDFAKERYREQQKQIRQRTGAEIDSRARRARAERARMRALQAESGLAGITMDSVARNPIVQGARDIGRLRLNQENQSETARLNLQSNLNTIEQPDYLGTALNTGLQIYGQGQTAGMWGG